MEITGFEPSIIQDNKIQKLCKRLNKFTLEEIALISEVEKPEMKIVLDNLIKENQVKLVGNLYVYTSKTHSREKISRLPQRFQHHSKEEIDMIIKCFCAGLPHTKTSLILNPQENCIYRFNLFFRNRIYENQKQKLLQYFKTQPKLPRIRIFFDKTFYFYYYDDFLYVSDELLTNDNSRKHSEKEIKQFKIMYSRLCRRLNHNTFKYYAHFHIAEQIWRDGKEFGQLREELYLQLFSKI